ncbi:MAG: DUF1643 domain-containing protein [Acholeplasmataceae bacterium]|jgi:hypothetical protein|nr:DUF1643 domain-containing protein [Acholeplasmataceae bacterium]
MIRFRYKLLIWFFQLFLVAVTFLLFAAFKLDDFFDGQTLSFFDLGHLVVILFRFLIYFMPAIVVWLFIKIKIKRLKFDIVESFKYQFILFTFLKASWVFSGMDYITSIGLFDLMDSFVIVAGLFLTLILKKKSSVDPDILESLDMNSTLSYDTSKWLFNSDDENDYRYSLGRVGKNNLIVFGINPNDGIPNLPEDSVKRVQRISNGLGYDGWIMLNVYPQRQSTVQSLPDIIDEVHHLENIKTIKRILASYPDAPVVAAWGNDIVKKVYLKKCILEINDIVKQQNRKWSCFKINKTGHPKHPLYLSSNIDKLVEFDFTSKYPPVQ